MTKGMYLVHTSASPPHSPFFNYFEASLIQRDKLFNSYNAEMYVESRECEYSLMIN